VLGMSSASWAQYTFSLEATELDGSPKAHFDRGNEFYLNIKLNNAGGVAGCAFTLEYPSDVLTPPSTDSEGISTGITSPFPFTYNTDQTHRGNSSESGKIYLAGAAINTSDGGSLYSSGPGTLFRVRFTVKNDAALGSFALSLKRTELFNPSAGYGTDVNGNGVYEPGGGDTMGTVAVLVGALPKTDPPSTEWSDLSLAFPVLLDTANLASLPFSSTDPNEELIPDSIDDAWELQYFESLNVADDTTDFDGDGYLDKYEYPLSITYPEGEWDPTVQNPADFSNPYYDPATDNRGPYQVVGPDPMQPFAGAGDNFDLDVYYFTSDGAQDLSGLTLRIHYDSTKLTWNGFSDILGTGLGTPSAAPQNDTSNFDGDASTNRFLLVPWSGGSWPGETCTEESPLKLYTVNFTVAGGLDEGTLSTIRFSAASVDPDYTFSSIPADFEVRLFAPGDVNMDGNITPADATGAFSLYLTKDWEDMTPVERSTADFNQDGTVTPADATAIFQHYLNQ
jgi:hypothetical protein